MRKTDYISPQADISEICFESAVLMTSYGDEGKPSNDIYFDEDNAIIL